LSDLGLDVTHLPTANDLGKTHQRTPDILASGLGKVDVFTPITQDIGRIVTIIAGKANQAPNIMVQGNFSDSQIAEITARVWGKSNIQTLIFQRPNTPITFYRRPKG
jgi:hypothetical protein